MSTGVPSILSPLLVTFTPPSVASRTIVWLLNRFGGAGLYLLFRYCASKSRLNYLPPTCLWRWSPRMTTALEKLSRMIRSPYPRLPGTRRCGLSSDSYGWGMLSGFRAASDCLNMKLLSRNPVQALPNDVGIVLVRIEVNHDPHPEAV